MKYINTVSILLLISLFMVSCVDYYDAKTEFSEPVLVVEGLVTNELKHHEVKLSLTVPFSNPFTFVPVRQARIYVKDNLLNLYHFSEAEPGHYISNEPFSGITGNVYTLHIETQNGGRYQSDEQTIMPTVRLDTIYGQMVKRQIYIPDNSGALILTEVEGIEVFADVQNYSSQMPRFRFDPTVLVQYITVLQPENPDSPLDFCRLKVGIENLVNLTVPENETATGSKLRHELGFIPAERKYYPGLFILHTRIDRRALIVRQYSLNITAFQYYKQLREQLLSDGNLFDPITVQLYGNIRSLSDPEELVLGFFEASGFHSQTFVLPSEPLMPHRISFKEVIDLDHLPRHQCYYDLRPPLWLY